MPIRARNLIRKMRGGAQSHLIQGEDNGYYVVKFVNNPQHRRILINEWLSGVFLKYLQVHTPEMALIEITEDFITAHPDLCVVLGSRREAP
ncbi:MAG TPA: HipA family kinase, partial [Bryobacteraceae bacterium]|nr:HipA family kinase [Bryobacteraceae bacterium]